MAKTVLVIDDEPEIRGLLELALRVDGYEVETACDGREALVILEDVPVDAVITDLYMPDLDGFELCLALRRDGRFDNLPIIVFTAFLYEDPVMELRHLRGVTILAKGSPLQELRDTVATAVEAPRPQTLSVRL